MAVVTVTIPKHGVLVCGHCGWTGNLPIVQERQRSSHWMRCRYRTPENTVGGSDFWPMAGGDFVVIIGLVGMTPWVTHRWMQYSRWVGGPGRATGPPPPQ